MAWFLRTPFVRPQHLLISRTDRIGDFVQSLPVFEAASRDLGISVSALVHETNAPLLKNNPFVQEVVAVSDQAEPRQTAGMILRMGFDGILVLVNDPRIRALLPLLHSIPLRLGPLSKPGMLLHLNYPVVQKRSKSLLNEAQYNLELLRGLGWQGSDQIHPRLYFTTEERIQQQAQLQGLCPGLELQKGYALLHAGMSGSALNWPLSHYRELLASLAGLGKQILLTGGSAAEFQTNEDLLQGLGSRVWNLAGKLTLRALGGLCEDARFFVGPSTGPTHMANAASCPVLSIYPPIRVQSARRWAPYLAQGRVFTPKVDCRQAFSCAGAACPHHPCMGGVTVEQVLGAALDLWP